MCIQHKYQEQNNHANAPLATDEETAFNLYVHELGEIMNSKSMDAWPLEWTIPAQLFNKHAFLRTKKQLSGEWVMVPEYIQGGSRETSYYHTWLYTREEWEWATSLPYP